MTVVAMAVSVVGLLRVGCRRPAGSFWIVLRRRLESNPPIVPPIRKVAGWRCGRIGLSRTLVTPGITHHLIDRIR
jgi:hypothetical protein